MSRTVHYLVLGAAACLVAGQVAAGAAAVAATPGRPDAGAPARVVTSAGKVGGTMNSGLRRAADPFWGKLGRDIIEHSIEHVTLTFFAMAAATAIALPLGIYLTRCRWPLLSGLIMGGAGVIQTVPSLALIAFIVLLFALVSRTVADVPTIGVFPGMVALVLYALLPILRNTYTGIRQVDPAVIEVARGMGMKPHQILFSVELPLSLPVIMAGIRISTVWTIGVATLCALIGAGGLGDLIMQGLRSIQLDYLLAGTVPAALLAIAFDWLLARLERWLTPVGMGSAGEAAPG